MAAHIETSPPAIAPVASATGVYAHGAAAGVLGAVTLAAWFGFLDFSRGHPLYTPTLLGALLFNTGVADASREGLAPSLSLTLAFTVVHALLFVVMGMVAARLIVMVGKHSSWLVILALLVVLLNLGFAAYAMTFSAVALDALDWPDVVLGNLIAAAAMTVYLLRSRMAA